MNHYLHLQEAIEWIEKHLQEELSMAEIASKSCFSTFHFQRLFQAISGFTVLEYIRRRRLSEAAKKLKDTELRILEVAILFQYGSQEAFTRAFTGYFGMTPAKFRREKEELKTGQQSKINFLQYPNNLKGNVNMYKPQIVELDEITIVGYPYQTTLNDDHYFEDIPGFYYHFGEQAYFMRIPNRARADFAYGIGFNYNEHGDFSFLIGEEVSEVDHLDSKRR